MPRSLYDDKAKAAFREALSPRKVTISLPEGDTTITKPFTSPMDWRDNWIYFLLIDRFNNPDPQSRPSDWDFGTERRMGGNFEGIRQKLPYLQDLGAKAIWLSPVLKNRQSASNGSYNGYGISDFVRIDPRFGTTPEKAEEEYVRLIDEAHARGIYVIQDIVFNHVGDVFAYCIDGQCRSEAPWSNSPYPILWRDETGSPRQDWSSLPTDGSISRDAGIWPEEFQDNQWYRREGGGNPSGSDIQADFYSLKDIKTEYEDFFHDHPVWNGMIRAYQYLIATYDIDAFRIDTIKHVERDGARVFCNAIREYACSIGKQNFFTFGEAKTGDEKVLTTYVGRYTSDADGIFGADACLDFALYYSLPNAAKGLCAVTTVEDVYNIRRQVEAEKSLLSTHSDAGLYYVKFLDNHDHSNRFLYPKDGNDYTNQVTLALACLFGVQGIPCVYYGTEQALKGTRDIYAADYDEGTKGRLEFVREALWGKENAFDQNHHIYKQLKLISKLWSQEPALRYGRQYFRSISGNNIDFGPSKEKEGVLAFSRILNDREVLVVANTSVHSPFQGWMVIDARINKDNGRFKILYSNVGKTGYANQDSGNVNFYDRSNVRSDGWVRRVPVQLDPMEVQIMVKESQS